MNSSSQSRYLVQIAKALVMLGLGALLLRACQEYYLLAPTIGPWFGKLTPDWGIAFIGLIVFCIAAFAGAGLVLWYPERAQPIARQLMRLRARLGWLRKPLILIVALLPSLFFLYTYWGAIFDGPALRLLALLASSLGAGFLLSAGANTTSELQQNEPFLGWPNFFLGALFTASLFSVAQLFTTLTNYPFSLTWSEGNRLYDFSLYLGADRYLYDGDLTPTRGAAGRHLLWGLIYAIPNTPIWLHRLWNIFLSTAPYLLLGYLLARWRRLKASQSIPGLHLWGFALWIYLFLMQGPIYTPLLLAATLIILTVKFDPQIKGKRKLLYWLVCIAGSAIAGIYASASRWTWFPAAATWAVFILMADFKFEKGESILSIIRRLVPVAIVAAAGLAGALAASPKLLTPEKVASGTAMSQPLLWYRLFPNATLDSGILWGLAVAALPLLLMLIWLVAAQERPEMGQETGDGKKTDEHGRTQRSASTNVKRRWPLNWLQILAYASASLIFLGIGLVASVKIGGGNNLHNLDMFLVSLALLAALALREGGTRRDFFGGWPKIMQVVLGLALFLPAWNAVKSGGPLELPPRAVVEDTLQDIQKKVGQAAKQGEVLLIDQRQLLTFGAIQGITLIPEYEKKYLMDQAMAGDAAYFEGFYNDLRNQRFELILIEPLFVKEKSQLQTFGEENNAWVQWVAEPLLCYYKPIKTFDEIPIQLLTRRDAPKEGCSP